MHFLLLAKRFFWSIHAMYSYRIVKLKRGVVFLLVLFFLSKKLTSSFTYACDENRLSRKMV